MVAETVFKVIEDHASATVFILGDTNEEESTTTTCATSVNNSSDDYFQVNETTSTDAPTTNMTTKRRRRRPQRTTEPPDPTCRVLVANTDGDQVLIGCTVYCKNYTKPHHNWIECVNITVETAFTMQNATRYICPMGYCTRGYCYRTGMKLPCWVSF
ncbi:hypothetical protein V5799_023063 [Amblyomma americanum]|uniref:Evasin n=1 Tax=Amblyomma americanum TaxID=6943 RepID=A0AAQ4FKE1_AMBAM